MKQNRCVIQPSWTTLTSSVDLLGELFETLHVSIGTIRNELDSVENSIEDLELMRVYMPDDRLVSIEKQLKELNNRINLQKSKKNEKKA